MAVIYAFAEKFPPTLINLPNKNYWFSSPELAARGYQIVKSILAFTGVFVNVTFLVCSYVIYQETGAQVPFHVDTKFLFGGVLMAAALFIILILRVAQVPKQNQN